MKLNNTPDKESVEFLYYIMTEFVSGNISPRVFCDEFYECFDIGIETSLLSSTEIKEFERLSEVAGRFSEFEEDRAKYPNAYSDEVELKEVVVNIKSKLKR